MTFSVETLKNSLREVVVDLPAHLFLVAVMQEKLRFGFAFCVIYHIWLQVRRQKHARVPSRDEFLRLLKAPTSLSKWKSICEYCLDRRDHPVELKCGHVYCTQCVHTLAYECKPGYNRCQFCHYELFQESRSYTQIMAVIAFTVLRCLVLAAVMLAVKHVHGWSGGYSLMARLFALVAGFSLWHEIGRVEYAVSDYWGERIMGKWALAMILVLTLFFHIQLTVLFLDESSDHVADGILRDIWANAQL